MDATTHTRADPIATEEVVTLKEDEEAVAVADSGITMVAVEVEEAAVGVADIRAPAQVLGVVVVDIKAAEVDAADMVTTPPVAVTEDGRFQASSTDSTA